MESNISDLYKNFIKNQNKQIELVNQLIECKTMTREETKELLFKDLCAMLSYGVILETPKRERSCL